MYFSGADRSLQHLQMLVHETTSMLTINVLGESVLVGVQTLPKKTTFTNFHTGIKH